MTDHTPRGTRDEPAETSSADAHPSIQFGALFYGAGGHLAGWRYPGANPRGQLDVDAYIAAARTLERGGFDAIFVADVVAIWGKDLDSLSRTARADFFEPITLLAAIAASTSHIGVVGTATTSYNEPYSIARRFATLDHISGGRAGWNVVTSVVPLEAANFGRAQHFEHEERYRRAEEFVDVVRRLWDGATDDAFLRDQRTGVYLDTAKRRAIDHDGAWFRIAGPLNVSRPPQGHPVVFQAGASPVGQAFAAKHGEVLFTATTDLDQAIAYRARVRELAVEAGRAADSIKVWPVFTPIVADTDAEAREKLDHLQSLLHDDVLRRSIQDNIGDIDFTEFDLDAPLPEIPESNRSKSRRDGILAIAREKNLTLRQLALEFNERGTTAGSPETIADRIESWFRAGAADGFNVSFPYLPDTLDGFVDRVLPILEERGVFRRHYGATLRDTLGLARPESVPSLSTEGARA
ncbi:LLM class flavin-dependent oxidoreductase [Galbitalea sp. SE-J8]|uniref:LLM class flavin-dependent oxidoreductase n=1 Tax=Galbitalea sp. SE-J8 TaxID=3054952 RepID=UPI00259C81BD|nr:LLM class flavin-dependent oxidoreductase [Galbitalea sp. SE-J8]MDM4761606.1 LLM class flavin-dependent oxidoreductase [Galbitalea sp. SE-J8]